MTPLIRTLISQLQELETLEFSEYRVPGLWVGAQMEVSFPSAPSYFLHQIRRFDAIRDRRRKGLPWTIERATAYYAMVRHCTSYDHGLNDASWRRTGTFLKLLALLPYLVELGVDTLILMPITEIGRVGRKGTLGSPYAVRHPFRLDPLLAEPMLDMTVDDQARVLIEVCHLLGMKVVLESVLRTAAIDSDLVQHHPEWFYWIDTSLLRAGDSFGAPHFSKKDLAAAREKVDAGSRQHLPAPADEYQALFDHMPLRIERDTEGWRGVGPRSKVLRIPGAFADWPPNDPQPAWTDVTYLRLHDHPSFRYMAYNTIRMFDEELDQPRHVQQSLWNMIVGIVPHFIRMYGIDGTMIDMGHALPPSLREKIVQQARSDDPDHIFLEENFALDSDSLGQGYDASLGYLPFDAADVIKLREFVRRVADRDIPIRYFATPESHNTPRIAAQLPSRAGVAVWIFLWLLPKGLPTIVAGMELAETTPINTGLGFTADDMRRYPASALPLFSDVSLPWVTGAAVSEWMIERRRSIELFSVVARRGDNDAVYGINNEHEGIVAFVRRLSGQRVGFIVVLNTTNVACSVQLNIPSDALVRTCAAMKGVSLTAGTVNVDLRACDVLVIPTYHAS